MRKKNTYLLGNPITDAGKRQQMVKMLAVVLIPVIVLTGMTANTFIVSLESYIVSSKISRILYFRYHKDLYIHVHFLVNIYLL